MYFLFHRVIRPLRRQCPLGFRKIHVGTAPPDKEIHRFHDNVFRALAARSPKLLSRRFKKLQDRRLRLASRVEFLNQTAEFV